MKQNNPIHTLHVYKLENTIVYLSQKVDKDLKIGGL